jgi:hypothetical protein
VIARAGLVALVLLVAALHVLVTAATRPMLQVSDEINYLYSAQFTAVREHGVPVTLLPCISPPDGTPLPLDPSGKRGYREVSARLLAASCRASGPYAAFVLTRVALGSSLLVIVACGYGFAAVVCPGVRGLPIAVAALLALHPVLVIYSAGITPDSWANAFAAMAWLAFALVLARPSGLWLLPVLTACVLLAVLWKDTTHFMAILPVTAVPLAVLRSRRVSPLTVGFGIAWLAVCVLVGAAAREWVRSPYAITELFVSRLTEAPLAVASALIADVLPRLPHLFVSSWTELGSFGASPRALATGVFVPIVVASVTALAGVIGSLFARTSWMSDDTAQRWRLQVGIWSLALLLCASQAAARRIAQPNADVDQGRWLFPLAVPLATAIVVGLMSWVRRPAAAVPFVVVGSITIAIVAHLQVVGHYYLHFPDTYVRARLFLAGSGGLDIGRERVAALVVRPDVLRDAGTMGFLYAAALASVAALLIATWRTSRPSPASEPSHATVTARSA